MPDIVTPSVEQCCVIKSLMNDEVKPEEICHRLHAQYGKETLSHTSVCDWYSKFLKAIKKSQLTAVCSVEHLLR